MKSNDLTQWQRHALRNKVRPMAQYINRLKKRMVSKAFRSDDPLFDAVLGAERATHALMVQMELLANPGRVVNDGVATGKHVRVPLTRSDRQRLEVTALATEHAIPSASHVTRQIRLLPVNGYVAEDRTKDERRDQTKKNAREAGH
jgi:hypothetical protein